MIPFFYSLSRMFLSVTKSENGRGYVCTRSSSADVEKDAIFLDVENLLKREGMLKRGAYEKQIGF